MKAGQLRYICKLYRIDKERDKVGGFIDKPVLIGRVWADVGSVSGRMFLSASQEQAETTTEIIIRYRSDVAQGWLIEDEKAVVTYQIEAVLPDKRRTELRLMCKVLKNA